MSDNPEILPYISHPNLFSTDDIDNAIALLRDDSDVNRESVSQLWLYRLDRVHNGLANSKEEAEDIEVYNAFKKHCEESDLETELALGALVRFFEKNISEDGHLSYAKLLDAYSIDCSDDELLVKYFLFSFLKNPNYSAGYVDYGTIPAPEEPCGLKDMNWD